MITCILIIVIATAKNGTDYVDNVDAIVIELDVQFSRFCINVTIINDNHRGQDRQFFVVLKLSRPNFPVLNNVTTVTIIENDG